jgi:Ca2+-binding EF-hand superfamily protein
MKFLIGVATLSVAFLASAQGPEGGRRGPRMDPASIALDADGNGVISAEEIRQSSAALKKLDKNDDGKLTEDELRPNFGPGGPGGPGGRGERGGPGGPPQEDLTETLMAFDRNGDGKLTKSEVPERMQNLFARADANQDGVLTKEELQKLASAQKVPGESVMGGRPGEGGGRGGPEGFGRREGFQGRGGPEGPGGMMRFSPILSALDADQDGVISAQEIEAAPAALKKLDKDGDGKLSQEELRPGFGPGGRRPEGRQIL